MRKIITVDCEYLKPKYAAAFLVIDNGRAAFIENNTAYAVPALLDALRSEGLTPEHVDFLIITHVHLDHAGGSSALMEACPNAQLLAHPRAAPHMIDPTKLVASARKVYGDEKFETLYGSIKPIPASRVRAMKDLEEIQLGSSTLKFLHTRGHANHHFCILEPVTRSIFTGDSFGIAYPLLQRRGLFIFPSTSPTDFDPAEAEKSIGLIRDSGARRAYLTHYGPIDQIQQASAQLLKGIEISRNLAEKAAASPDLDETTTKQIETDLRGYFAQCLRANGLEPTTEDWDLLQLDLELNAAGIVHYARKKKESAATEK